MTKNTLNAPERVIALLKSMNLTSQDSLWNPVKTNPKLWVIKHKTLELIAASKGISFDPPVVVEADSLNRVATIVVTGHMGKVSEWSFGESSANNTVNKYPFAMAEKRGKDRCVLKLLGLHGDVYSESEIEGDQPKKTEPEPLEKLITQSQIDSIQSYLRTLGWSTAEFTEKHLAEVGSIEKLPKRRADRLITFLRQRNDEMAVAS